MAGTDGLDLAGVPPSDSYIDALRRYDEALLGGIARTLLNAEGTRGREALVAAIHDRLGETRYVTSLLGRMPYPSRLAMSLLAIGESAPWPLAGLDHALRCLGVDAREALGALAEHGLIVLYDPASRLRELAPALEPASATWISAHPAALASTRAVAPEGAAPPACGPVKDIREADGLEPILRLAVVWQRVEEAPLRQTQQGVLYKRDRDRIEEDQAIAGPIADAIEPIPDIGAFLLALARRVGLVSSEPASDRLNAAPPAFWAENAFHLPQMVAAAWLALREWHELGGMQREGAVLPLALPYVRHAVLLWLAARGEDEWVASEDLAAHLRELSPGWDRVTLAPEQAGAVATAPSPGNRSRAAKGPARVQAPADIATLEAMLLGIAYQFGLVRAATESATGRRAVQLTALGRYLLALGPPPPPRPVYAQFLYVQPSFEVIAYRQGLTPAIVGELSRFLSWLQVSAALTMRITAESVYRGLEGGMTPGEMLDQLARHSVRALPSGVSEAVESWAGRRERVTYYGSATLVEFASAEDLETALGTWPDNRGPAPLRAGDRLLLVENESSVPFERFRMAGARDYRRPPEVCVEVGADGVSLTLELARSDLLVDTELMRFADEGGVAADRTGRTGPRRFFRVSADSLARAAASGLTAAQLSHWFQQRTGADTPPAIRLLLSALSSQAAPLEASHPLLIRTTRPEVLDGLAQHPDTAGFLGERLGPTAAVIVGGGLDPLRRALERLGLRLNEAEG